MTAGGKSVNTDRQKRTLLIVFALNLLLFITLGTAGLVADSSALIANAVDNLSDTIVYAISVLAVGGSGKLKRSAARLSGIMLVIFAIGVLFDALRRPFFGPEPAGVTMMAMATFAAVVNLICLRLLKPLKTDDVNLRAAQTFSVNDFFSNGGILIAGALVMWTGSWIPDVVVGLVVAAVAVFGGFEILRDAKRESEPSNG
ncbi:MAG TPA: cation transporter [Hyphomicrobium sp.]|jgi:cobalt-zinc-cadmium efflux system protein|nr:cation transporter [Hyphomonadaceae bacterium]HPG89372.1 cation transporter [Hyphomicrobium sp.]HPN05094.1 cation transporter [Hyphomonadaceae bacterium]